MFIKSIPKKDKTTGKVYLYYRLCESYRLGSSIRHRNILSLGNLDELTENQQFKFLADRIEQLIDGKTSLFTFNDPVVEKLAQGFYQQIVSQRLTDKVIPEVPEKDLQVVDLSSVGLEEVREIGSEWLCLQALNQLDMRGCLENVGISPVDINLSMAHIISRAVFPASEHATAQWMKDNSAVCELLDLDKEKISHHKLYQISRNLYQHRDRIEPYLSHKTNELFDLEDKIILYDLTNSHFEGQKQNSQIAAFGHSKQKRYDARLVTLALVVNPEGFVKYSQIYPGNIGETTTLEKMVESLSLHTSATGRKPMVVLDAGIASDENLAMLRRKGHGYLCVLRGKLKEYHAVKSADNVVTITDRRDNLIELLLVESQGIDDTLLYVRSQRKAAKEISMHERFTSHYEEGLQQILHGIKSKGGTKVIEKVWERIGRLKQKYPSAHRFFALEVPEENGKATDLQWKKVIPKARKEEGVYFLRTSEKNIDEKGFWDIYNIIREIEATFRVLKSDLNLRPVFHQMDEATNAHLFLAVLAYQMVNTIRYQLKAKGIRHNWSNIVRIMNTQKAGTVTMLNQNEMKIHIRKCSTPELKAREIYNALGYKQYPFTKKSVLPETENSKIQKPNTG
ncbi:MAG: IS1634 family transposase [Fibrobacter sp.]|nr:IS1634 family transposase [Fibrobacter sp.]